MTADDRETLRALELHTDVPNEGAAQPGHQFVPQIGPAHLAALVARLPFADAGVHRADALRPGSVGVLLDDQEGADMVAPQRAVPCLRGIEAPQVDRDADDGGSLRIVGGLLQKGLGQGCNQQGVERDARLASQGAQGGGAGGGLVQAQAGGGIVQP